MTPAAFEEAWTAGRSLSQPDAVALALEVDPAPG